MAGKIVLAELDIDSAALLKSAAANKKAIDDLKKSLNGLRDENGNVTEAYVQQEVEIKKLSTEYNAQKNVINSLTDATGKLALAEKAVTDLVNKESTSIAGARKNNSDLLKVRNEINLSTVEGQKALTEINKKLDENNAFIKENVSEYEKQKIGIGDYATGVAEGIKQSGLFSTALSKLGADGEQLAGVFGTFAPVFNILNQQFNTIIGDFKGFGAAAGEAAEGAAASAESTKELGVAQKAMAVATNIGTAAMRIFTLALAATGIGLIIAAIALLIGYFSKLDPVVDKIEQVFAGLGGVIDFLEEKIGSFVTSITSVGDLLNKLGDFIAHPIDSLKELGKGMEDAAIAAAKLKERQQDLQDQQEINSIVNKQEESDIARLLIQAKDRSKSVEEQNKLFADAEKLNRAIFDRNKKTADEQMKLALDTAVQVKKLNAEEIKGLQEKGIAYANYLLNQGRIRKEDYEALQKAYDAQIDVENQSNEQLDKITTKKNNALEKQQAANEAAAKKAADARQKELDDAAKYSKALLDLFNSEQSVKAKSLQEEIYFAEQTRDKKLKIAQSEFDASKKTAADKLVLETALNNAQLEFYKAQMDAAVKAAELELNITLDKNQKILDNDKFLSESLLNQKKTALEEDLQAERDYQATRLKEGAIDQQAYNDTINKINEDYRVKNEELAAERAQADADKKLIDVENAIAGEQANSDALLQLQVDRLALQRDAELKATDKTGADRNLIIKKYGEAEKQLRQAVEFSKLQTIQDGLTKAMGLFKENTLAYKVLAIAEATINTYKAATAALSTQPAYLGIALAAVDIGLGLANVAKIAGVKFEKGGIATKGIQRIQGKSHAQGGEPVYIGRQYVGEAQGDEGVGILNRGAFGAFMDFNNKFGDGKKSGPTFMAGGGIITQAVQASGGDASLITETVIATVQAMPRPVVLVQDIANVSNEVATVEAGADF